MQAGIVLRPTTSSQGRRTNRSLSSLSMMEPQEQSTHGPGRDGKCEKPSGFWQPHETHKKQADDNHESNRVAGPISGPVSSEGNNSRGMRKIAVRLLGNAMMKVHGRQHPEPIYTPRKRRLQASDSSSDWRTHPPEAALVNQASLLIAERQPKVGTRAFKPWARLHAKPRFKKE